MTIPWPGLARLDEALHALASPPDSPGWNVEEFEGVFDPAVPHRDAAVLVGLVERASGTQVLLTRRTDVLRHHAGQVSFPGGRIEPDDRDVIAAALRETHEEIGVDATQVTPRGFLDPLLTVSGFRVLPVVAWVDSGYVAHPDPNEVAEVFEVPLAFLMEPANLITHEVEFKGRPRHVLEYVKREGSSQRIWGVTAAILLNFRERLATVAT